MANITCPRCGYRHSLTISCAAAKLAADKAAAERHRIQERERSSMLYLVNAVMEDGTERKVATGSVTEVVRLVEQHLLSGENIERIVIGPKARTVKVEDSP